MNEKEVIDNTKAIVERLFTLKNKIEDLTRELKILKKDYDKNEADLHEDMLINKQTKTATYEGIGGISLEGYRQFASVLKEDEQKLFTFLRDQGLSDVIKYTVSPATLSATINDLEESGITIPSFIKIFKKPKLKLKK